MDLLIGCVNYHEVNCFSIDLSAAHRNLFGLAVRKIGWETQVNPLRDSRGIPALDDV